MAILTEAEKARVSAAVAAAERNTAGEIVVVIAHRSADYAAPRALLAACVSVAVALEAGRLLPSFPLWSVLLGQLPFGLLLYWGLGFGGLLRLVVPARVRKTRVEQTAMRVFLEAGVGETRDRSGVLIYLSEAERRATILADSGIHARVPDGEWQADVDTLVAAVGRGQTATGLVTTIERIGSLLAAAFPPRSDDKNELSDPVREI